MISGRIVGKSEVMRLLPVSPSSSHSVVAYQRRAVRPRIENQASCI